MKPRFNIYPPSVGTFTRMKVYRADTQVGIIDTIPIYDGVFKSVFTDDTPGSSRVIWYLVLVAQETGEYIPLIPFSVAYCSDWGPAVMSIATGMAYARNPAVAGNAQGGVLTSQTTFDQPTQVTVTNWAAMVSAATGTATGQIPAVPTTAFVWNLMYANGKIILVPQNTEGPLQITNQSVTQIRAAELTQQLATYLNEPSRTENIYTVAGFKWKLKVLDTAMSDAIGECFIPNATNTAIKAFASPIVRSLAFVAGTTSARRFEGNSFYALTPPTTDLIPTFYPFTYFEYVGPA